MKSLDIDVIPLLLVPVLALIALPLIGSGSTWLTLTVAGLAMGMIIFIIASGLTLVFGLMDVLNFGHGVFIALGAFVATSVLGAMSDWTQSANIWRNLVAVLPAMVVAMLVAGAVGLAGVDLVAGMRRQPRVVDAPDLTALGQPGGETGGGGLLGLEPHGQGPQTALSQP